MLILPHDDGRAFTLWHLDRHQLIIELTCLLCFHGALLAGECEPVLGLAGSPSRRLTWGEVAEARPHTVVFMPCGYGLEEAVAEGRQLLEVPELAGVSHVYAAAASSLFSRPGPRLVAGVEALAGVLHPEVMPRPASDAITALR